MARIAITDHALVRWLARSGAMDVETLREWMAQSFERAAAAAEVLEQERYNILAAGMVFVVKDGVIVTVFEDDGRHDHSLRPGRD